MISYLDDAIPSPTKNKIQQSFQLLMVIKRGIWVVFIFALCLVSCMLRVQWGFIINGVHCVNDQGGDEIPQGF
jgi:hypothetical protein